MSDVARLSSDEGLSAPEEAPPAEAPLAELPALRPSAGRILAMLGVIAAIGLLLALTAGGIGDNLVYYWGPSEVLAAGERAVGATIRLGGQVAPGSVVRASGVSSLEFDVMDVEGKKVHVRSSGVPPQMFREKIGVVVEGTMKPEGYFEASRLMVSHDNQYRVPGDPKADMKSIMSTTQELQGSSAGAPPRR